MGSLIGLLLGVGLFCIWWSCWVPDEPRPTRRRGPFAAIAADLAVLSWAGLRPATLVALAALTGLAVGPVLWVLTGSGPIAVVFAVGATWAPVAAVRALARRRRVGLRQEWPEAVDNLASGIRAGLSLPEALSQLGSRGPLALRPQFELFARDYRSTGRFSECLDRLKDRLADPVADRIVEALRLTRDVGGTDLGKLLRTLSVFLREDARTRAEIEARQSWTVNAARLAVAAPWIVLGLLSTRREAVEAYNSLAGVMVLAAGAGCCVLAYRLMVRLGRLPDEQRVLR